MPGSLLTRLEADGLLRREGDTWRTTRRWQGAMMRAAARLIAIDEPGVDLRIPVTTALLDLYGENLPDEQLAELVETMGLIEAQELARLQPRPGIGPQGSLPTPLRP